MSFIFLVVLRTWKRLTPKDVAAVKGFMDWRFVENNVLTVSICSEPSSSTEQLKQYKSWVSNERWNELKKIAEAAMKERKVFMIKGGGFPAVRRALIERGWIEKYDSIKVGTT
jgi:hypothetical protein